MVYRLKHIPTGMYYCPSRELKISPNAWAKSNLSKMGKVYAKKPSFSYIGPSFYNHLPLIEEMKTITPDAYTYFRRKNLTMPFIASEWIIEKIEEEKYEDDNVAEVKVEDPIRVEEPPHKKTLWERWITSWFK